jgi:hypothetical protein
MIALLSQAAFGDPPPGGTSDKTSNKVTFNVDGNKDYYVGKDLENDGQGWYFGAQDGTIIYADAKGEICARTGMRPKGVGQSNADNKLGPPMCGSGINQTRQVGSNGSYKETIWQYHPKDQNGNPPFVTITPTDEKGNNTNPVLEISGTNTPPDPGSKDKTRTSIKVKVQDMPSIGTQPRPTWDISMESPLDPGGADQPEVTCVQGQFNDKSKKNLVWDPKLGVTNTSDPNGSDKTVTADNSPAAIR